MYICYKKWIYMLWLCCNIMMFKKIQKIICHQKWVILQYVCQNTCAAHVTITVKTLVYFQTLWNWTKNLQIYESSRLGLFFPILKVIYFKTELFPPSIWEYIFLTCFSCTFFLFLNKLIFLLHAVILILFNLPVYLPE